MNAALPPKLAMPEIVLAAEPPDASIAFAHGRVDLLGALRLDERHRTLDEAVGLDEGVVLMAEHIDEGVADPHHVEVGGSSGSVSITGAEATGPSGSGQTGAPVASPTWTNPYRLPRTVLPRRYALTLTPDLGCGDLRRLSGHRCRGGASRSAR